MKGSKQARKNQRRIGRSVTKNTILKKGKISVDKKQQIRSLHSNDDWSMLDKDLLYSVYNFLSPEEIIACGNSGSKAWSTVCGKWWESRTNIFKEVKFLKELCFDENESQNVCNVIPFSFSGDGRFVYSARYYTNSTFVILRIWDAKTGEEVAHKKLPTPYLRDDDFEVEGRVDRKGCFHLFSSRQEGTVFNIQVGSELSFYHDAHLTYSSTQLPFDFSVYDGEYVVSPDGGMIGILVEKANNALFFESNVLDDDTFMFYVCDRASGKSVRLDMEGIRLKHYFAGGADEGDFIHFSNDNSRICLSLSDPNNTHSDSIGIWDTSTGNMLKEIPRPLLSEKSFFSVSADGQYILLDDECGLRVIPILGDEETEERVYKHPGIQARIIPVSERVSVSPLSPTSAKDVVQVFCLDHADLTLDQTVLILEYTVYEQGISKMTKRLLEDSSVLAGWGSEMHWDGDQYMAGAVLVFVNMRNGTVISEHTIKGQAQNCFVFSPNGQNAIVFNGSGVDARDGRDISSCNLFSITK